MARRSNINTSLSDVKFHSVSLIPKEGSPVSLAGLWNVINIYEDLFRPTIMGNIQIKDTVNLRGTYAFAGDEKLYISFSKPGINGMTQRYAKTFTIYSQNDLTQDESSGVRYTLRFCSEELIISNKMEISRSFKDGVVSDYIKSICTSDLKLKASQFKIFEDTVGTVDLIVNNNTPFEAIDLLEQYAVNSIGSPLLFFENFYGYNLASIASMFSGTSVVPGGLNISMTKSTADAADYVPVNFNEILNFNIKKSTDILESTKNLTYAGRLYTFDPLRQRYDFRDYSILNQDMGNFADKEGGFPLGGNSDGRNFAVVPESNPRFMITNYDQTNQPWFLGSNTRIQNLTRITPYENDTTIRIKNTNIETTLMERQSMLNMLETTIIDSCEVAGNPGFTVGMPVDINMPAFTSNDESKRNLDPFLGGRYLIAKVRHNLTKTTGMRTFVSLMKNSLLNPPSSYSET